MNAITYTIDGREMNIEAELISALRTILPWAGPQIGASDARMLAIRIAQDALRKADAINEAKRLREEFGV